MNENRLAKVTFIKIPLDSHSNDPNDVFDNNYYNLNVEEEQPVDL